MKKNLSLLLCCTIMLSACGQTVECNHTDYDQIKQERDELQAICESYELLIESQNSIVSETIEQVVEDTSTQSVEEQIAAMYQETNPDIPIGTEYTFGQGEYVVGEDIPEGRYRISFKDGNQFGGYFSGKGECWTDFDINSDYDTCYFLTNGDTFKIELVSATLTKIPSIQNEIFKSDKGTYKLGSGRYYAGIDFPLGKYNIVAKGGNQFGLYITAGKNDFSLDIDESYSNIKFTDDFQHLDIQLGYVELIPAE